MLMRDSHLKIFTPTRRTTLGIARRSVAGVLVLQQRLVTSGSARVVRFSGGGLAVASPV